MSRLTVCEEHWAAGSEGGQVVQGADGPRVQRARVQQTRSSTERQQAAKQVKQRVDAEVGRGRGSGLAALQVERLRKREAAAEAQAAQAEAQREHATLLKDLVCHQAASGSEADCRRRCVGGRQQ